MIIANISEYIANFPTLLLSKDKNIEPWVIVENITTILLTKINDLSDDFVVDNDIAIHKTAVIESGVILKPPLIVGENVFIGANCYLRNGVYLGNGCKIGPGCEIKSSIICDNTSIAHFNFIGDSILGCHVNFEAGALTANHYNERFDKTIYVLYKSEPIKISTNKFGALVGDFSRIGANSVLSPGTILKPKSIVKRLELVEQIVYD